MASEIKGTGIVASLAKLKNYFMSWHTQEYDNLHDFATNIATETNTGKPATTQAIKDYVSTNAYDDTEIKQSITLINTKLGDTSRLPVANNISQSIININNTLSILNKAASKTQNGYMTASYAKALERATYEATATTSPSASSKNVISGGTVYWHRYGRMAVVKISGYIYKDRDNNTTYTIQSHVGVNAFTPTGTVYGGHTYDECKWICITDNNDAGWALKYKPLNSGKHTINATIVYMCKKLYPE